MRTKSDKVSKIPKLSEIAGTKTVTKEQWSTVVAAFRAAEEKVWERRKVRYSKQGQS